ncbi:hypothetical protein BDV12DRAFT_179662 [Aspergillus spectabilis]
MIAPLGRIMDRSRGLGLNDRYSDSFAQHRVSSTESGDNGEFVRGVISCLHGCLRPLRMSPAPCEPS